MQQPNLSGPWGLVIPTALSLSGCWPLGQVSVILATDREPSHTACDMFVSVNKLPNSAGNTSAFGEGVSEDGSVIAGGQTIAGNLVPTVWTNSLLQNLPLIVGGTYGYCNNVTRNGGKIIGVSNDATNPGNNQAVMWERGRISIIFPPLVVGKPTTPYACSVLGDIVYGDAADAGNQPHPVYWNALGITALPRLPGSVVAQIFGCSFNGQFPVGYSGDAALIAQPVYWRLNTLRLLPTLPGTVGGSCLAADDQGIVIGGYCATVDGNTAPFTPCYWRGEIPTALPTLPGSLTGGKVNAVSFDGTLFAGYCDDSVGTIWATIWRNGAIEKLPTIAGGFGTTPGIAIAISRFGTIVGTGDDTAGILAAVFWPDTVTTGTPQQPVAFKCPARPFLPVAQGIR